MLVNVGECWWMFCFFYGAFGFLPSFSISRRKLVTVENVFKINTALHYRVLWRISSIDVCQTNKVLYVVHFTHGFDGSLELVLWDYELWETKRPWCVHVNQFLFCQHCIMSVYMNYILSNDYVNSDIMFSIVSVGWEGSLGRNEYRGGLFRSSILRKLFAKFNGDLRNGGLAVVCSVRIWWTDVQ